MAKKDKIFELTDANFAAETAKGICLVHFIAKWCSICRMTAPAVAALAKQYAGRVKVCNLDTDAHRETAAKFVITAIPTLIVLEDGVAVKRFIGGITSEDDLAQALDEALAGK